MLRTHLWLPDQALGSTAPVVAFGNRGSRSKKLKGGRTEKKAILRNDGKIARRRQIAYQRVRVGVGPV